MEMVSGLGKDTIGMLSIGYFKKASSAIHGRRQSQCGSLSRAKNGLPNSSSSVLERHGECMPLPPEIRDEVNAKLRGYCENRVPAHLRDEIRVGFEVRGNSVTLFEERPYWRDKNKWSHTVVAQFRFDPTNCRWTLFCADRNSKWHRLPDPQPSKSIDALLKEVDSDSTGIFWG
jgi:hypothetical protein